MKHELTHFVKSAISYHIRYIWYESLFVYMKKRNRPFTCKCDFIIQVRALLKCNQHRYTCISLARCSVGIALLTYLIDAKNCWYNTNTFLQFASILQLPHKVSKYFSAILRLYRSWWSWVWCLLPAGLSFSSSTTAERRPMIHWKPILEYSVPYPGE